MTEKHLAEELSTLNAVAETLNQELHFADALSSALKRLVAMLGLSSGWVFLSNVRQGDRHQGGFHLATHTAIPPALMVNHYQPLCQGSCDCQWLFRRGELDKGVNIVHCSRLEKTSGDKGGLEIHASIPLLGREGPHGILNVAAQGARHFDEMTLQFLTTLGRQLGIAYERAVLQQEHTEEVRYLAVLEERTRLLQEMHDAIAQLLFAADLSLETAKSRPAEHSHVDRASELVSAALSELRALVEVSRPAELSNGLTGALKRLAQRSSGVIAVHLELADVVLSQVQSAVLYRIAQEALHNCLRHAKAEQVWIRLLRQPSKLLLIVEDDGRGLGDFERGFGMNSMEARILELSGTIDFLERSEGGSCVKAEMPWPD